MANTKKTYTYKTYNALGEQIFSYEENDVDIISPPSYTSKINGGSGVVNLEFGSTVQKYLAAAQAESIASIRIYVHDKDTPPQGTLLWVGEFSGSSFSLNEHIKINLKSNSISVFLSRIIARITTTTISSASLGDRRIQYSNDAPEDIIKDLLNQFNQINTAIFYVPESIATTGLTIDVTINAMTFLEAIQEVMKFLPDNYFFRIEGNGLFVFGITDFETIDHTLFIGKEIVSGEFDFKVEDIVNAVEIHGGDTGAGDNLYKRYVNTSSLSAYGYREKIISNGNITTNTGAELLGQRILEKNISPVRSITAVVLDNNSYQQGYDIESLKVGQVISVISTQIATSETKWDDATWDLSFWDYDADASLGVPFQIKEIQYNKDRAIVTASDVSESQNDTIDELRKKEKVLATAKSPNQPV